MKRGRKMKKFIIRLFVCIIVGTLITVGSLKIVDSYLYKITQSSYLEADTYRTSGEVELKSEDVISIPEDATQLQFSYNNKYYAYLEDGSIHINTIEDKKEHDVVTEDNPICYYYMLYDKNLIMYFVEDTSGSYTTLSLKTYEIATKRTTEYNDIDVNNFSKIKDITMSPLVNIIYINVETKSALSTNNIVYKIDLFNSMSQVRSGMIISKIRMLQHVDKLYYGDTSGGVYTSGASVNYLFGYQDVELIGINSDLEDSDDDEKLYYLDTETNDKIYVVSGSKLVDTIYLSDKDIVSTYNEYGDVYLIYPTYILKITGENPYKRIAKLSKYVTFEAIKGDTVYLRTSTNKIVTTTLLDN
jgi:hypothetical protein